MSVRTWSVLLFVSCCLPVSLVAQDDGMVIAKASTSKFVSLPGVPACMTAAVHRGDPTKGASTLLLKFTPGCVVPWHWHTTGEQLAIISGRGKADMKGGKSMAMNVGDYAYLPPKNIHQFTAVTAVLMYFNPDGAFDIHYLDKSWNEIPPEQALKPAARKALPAKSSSKQ
jgi:quercetin dioxygenase-like cupin family protein